jgi:hypothetical protein
MIRSAVAAAARMADGGYSTVLEGIFGPWYFDLVRDELTTCSVGVSYVVLRPTWILAWPGPPVGSLTGRCTVAP